MKDLLNHRQFREALASLESQINLISNYSQPRTPHEQDQYNDAFGKVRQIVEKIQETEWKFCSWLIAYKLKTREIEELNKKISSLKSEADQLEVQKIKNLVGDFTEMNQDELSDLIDELQFEKRLREREEYLQTLYEKVQAIKPMPENKFTGRSEFRDRHQYSYYLSVDIDIYEKLLKEISPEDKDDIDDEYEQQKHTPSWGARVIRKLQGWFR